MDVVLMQVAIPVVPTVRVIITFTKFMDLQPVEQFYTPLSSPRHLIPGRSNGDQQQKKKQQKENNNNSASSSSSSTSSSWLRRSNSSLLNKQNQRCSSAHQIDPFVIPTDYTWTSIDDDTKDQKMKKSKSIKKSK